MSRPGSAASAALAVLALAAAAAVSLGCPGRSSEASETFYLGGIQVNEPDHAAWVESLRQAGMNTVEVTVYAHQGDWDSDHLWYEEEEPWVVSEIRAAERAGLSTVLILRVALDHAFERNRFLWHGMIMPRTDAQVESWFDQYGAFVTKWARIARDEGVDVLGIASELSALTSTHPVTAIPELEEYYLNAEKQEEHRESLLEHGDALGDGQLTPAGGESYPSLDGYLDDETATFRRWARQVAWADEEVPTEHINRRRRLLERQWVELVDAVRRVYPGPLTYAANFDQYRQVGFWGHLDLMGINAYFPLRQRLREVADPEELYPEILAGWRRVLGEIGTFRREEGLEDMPVLFTEIGFTSLADSTLAPWAGTGFSVVPAGGEEERLVVWGERPKEPRERALALRALAEADSERSDPFLAGLLYWKLSTDPGHREIEPFVLILGSDDPALPELRRFLRR